MSLSQRIKDLATDMREEMVEIRRHLHMHPELSFEEHETSAFIREKLENMGFTGIETKAGTGLVCVLEGAKQGKTIALRADIDALPIMEKNEDKPYRSTRSGVMHACGHDVHTTSLLGACRILKETGDQLKGSVKFIFQPGEERIPGGASLLVKEGVLKNPAPQSIFGQHVMPLIPTGQVGFRKGMYMASTDEIYIKVKGKGGHGAMPENNVDPVVIASHLVVSLQQIVSRHAPPRIPSVLSFGKMIAEGATNVIPGEVYLEGTFRTLNEPWRAQAKKAIHQMAEGLVASMGGTCEIEIRHGYPYLENDPGVTDRAMDYAREYLGEENVQELDVWMAGEDFAYYSQEIPACFYRLGVRNEAKGITSSVHTPTFDVDEDALITGAGLMAWISHQELGSNG